MLVSPYLDNAGASGLGSEQVWGWKGPGSHRWTACLRCHKGTGHYSTHSGGTGYLSARKEKRNSGYTVKLLSGAEAESSRHNTQCRDLTRSSGANVSMRANEAFQGVRLKSIPLSKHSMSLPSESIFCMCVRKNERCSHIEVYTVHKHRGKYITFYKKRF